MFLSTVQSTIERNIVRRKRSQSIIAPCPLRSAYYVALLKGGVTHLRPGEKSPVRPQHDHGRTAVLQGTPMIASNVWGTLCHRVWNWYVGTGRQTPAIFLSMFKKVAMDVSRSPSTRTRAADVSASRGTLLQRVEVLRVLGSNVQRTP